MKIRPLHDRIIVKRLEQERKTAPGMFVSADFEAIDPNEPATLANVLEAVIRLQAYDEAKLAEVISEGRLQEFFPFRVRSALLPRDAVDEAEVPEASPDSRPDLRYAELMSSGPHSRAIPAPADAIPKHAEQGEVRAVGERKAGKRSSFGPLHIKVGDRVLFEKYAGQMVKVEGEELLVMREEDIMGVIPGADSAE